MPIGYIFVSVSSHGFIDFGWARVHILWIEIALIKNHLSQRACPGSGSPALSLAERGSRGGFHVLVALPKELRFFQDNLFFESNMKTH